MNKTHLNKTSLAMATHNNTWLTRIVGLALAVGLALSASPASAGHVVAYVLTDHLGSPVIEMDISGQVIKREVYGPYGQAQISPNNSGIGYTGHMHDGDTGLTYMQARYFDPEAIRFLSTDPVRFSPGQPNHFNPYWYAEGNPYKYTDPDGREIVFADTRVASKTEIQEVISNLKNNGEVGDKFIEQLESSSNKFIIRGGTVSIFTAANSKAASSGKGSGGTITVNMRSVDVVSTTAGPKAISQEEAALHEIVHGADADKGILDSSINPATGNPVKEDRAMKVENLYRDEQGEPGHREKHPRVNQ